MVRLLEIDKDSILRGEREFTPGGPESPTAGRFGLADLFVFAGLAQRP